MKIVVNKLLIRCLDKVVLTTNVWHKKHHYDLVITRTDRIGDFILSLDSLQALLEEFYGKRILYVCSSFTSEIAKSSGLFTDVMVVEDIDSYRFERSFFYHYRYIRPLLNIDSDYVINPVWSRISPTDWIVKYIKAKNKIGCDGDQTRTSHPTWANQYYTRLIRNNPYDSELLNNQYFINKVFNPEFKAGLPRIEMIYTVKDCIVDGKYVLIGISASYSGRIWPIDRMLELIRYIPNEFKIVLLGYGDSDVDSSKYIITNNLENQVIIDMVNRTSITDVFRLVQNAQFVIGMDSAPIHIAAAARVPSICIAPGAHYDRFVPYPEEVGEEKYRPHTVSSKNKECFKCNYQCTRKDFGRNGTLPCIMDITVEMVIQEVNEILADL